MESRLALRQCVFEKFGSRQKQEVEPIIDVVKQAYEGVAGKEPPAANTFRASIWTDINVCNEMGNPCLKFGLGGKKYAIRSEQIDIEEIYVGAQVYALAPRKSATGKNESWKNF